MTLEHLRLSEALGIFLEAQRGIFSPATTTWYRSLLQPLVDSLGDPILGNITLQDLRAWRAGLVDRMEREEGDEERLSIWSVHAYIRSARHFFKWLVDEGTLGENPAARLELPSLPEEPRKGVKDWVRNAMLAAAREDPRDYALLLFLADTACRAAGVAGLKLEDLELEIGQAFVREKGRGGNRRGRYVYFNPETAQALARWLLVRPGIARKTSKTVFVATSNRHWGKPLTTEGIYEILKRLAEKAGVLGERWNPHQWRHGAARAMLRAGAKLEDVSDLLGHRDIRVTDLHYGGLSDADLQKIHNTYSWVKDLAAQPGVPARPPAPGLAAGEQSAEPDGEELLEQFLENQTYAPTTKNTYFYVIRSFKIFLACRGLTLEGADVETAQSWLDEKITQRSLRKAVSAVRSYARWVFGSYHPLAYWHAETAGSAERR